MNDAEQDTTLVCHHDMYSYYNQSLFLLSPKLTSGPLADSHENKGFL